MDFINKIFSALGGSASGGQSKKIRVTLIAIGVLIILLVVFQVGMAVGFRKANFSFKWGENYHRNFGGPRSGFLEDFVRNDFMGKDFMAGHGVFGQIIKIDISTNSEQIATIVIKGSDNAEKIVSVKDDTAINRFREKIKVGDLKIDDQIVVIGEPNDSGQIEAKLIRVMPLPSSFSASSTPEGFFPAPMPMMRRR